MTVRPGAPGAYLIHLAPRDMPANRFPFSAENSGTGLYIWCIYSSTGKSIEAIFQGKVRFDVKNTYNLQKRLVFARTGIMFSEIYSRIGSYTVFFWQAHLRCFSARSTPWPGANNVAKFWDLTGHRARILTSEAAC